jgi:hypothetical protein
MSKEKDLIAIPSNLDIDENGGGLSPERLSRYLSAGILLPDEVRLAEKLLRRQKI